MVALSGGSTPRRLYELLAREPFRRQIPWASVEFFWGDERTVPPDHPDSNFRMANEVLLAPLGISPARIHRIEAERPDRDAAARAYETELARVLGEPPRLDLVLLGLGADGHTASIFPQTPAVRERVRWVVAHHVPALGADRITLTAPIINQAACVVFLVAGAEKATTAARVLHGPPEPDLLPQPSSSRPSTAGSCGSWTARRPGCSSGRPLNDRRRARTVDPCRRDFARLGEQVAEAAGGYTSYLEVLDADRSLFNADMETGMRPIGYASHPSMSYRVPMDVIHVTVEVSLIADEMFPETALP